MRESDILFMSATELGRKIRAKELSSVEVTKLYLDALDKGGRKLNAVAELTRELALMQAAQADKEIASGHHRGVLHGVPYGAKDLFATKGIPTRWGSPAHKDQIFNFDAVVVERLAEAGAVLVAKLAMIELAGGGGYESAGASITGPCRNPFDTKRWAGGSSSGSGAAVGAGMVGFAMGTETWGSITVPASFCNVTGLRPTYGRVPRSGAMALCFSMDKIGPMARTAEDCGHILDIISGHDDKDETSSFLPFKFNPKGSSRRLKIGLLPTDYEKNKAPDAQKLFEAATKVIISLGHSVKPMKLPDLPYDQAATTIVDVEGAAMHESLIRSTRLELLADPAQVTGFTSALQIPGVDYLRANKIRTMAKAATVDTFKQFDVLMAPTLLHGSPLVDKSLNEGWVNMGGNGGPGNLLGWPSISLPMGIGKNGLPIGLELISAPYAEQTILNLAMSFQKATDWHKLRPKA